MVGWLYILIAIAGFGLLSFISKYGSMRGSSPVGITLTLFAAGSCITGAMAWAGGVAFTGYTVALGCVGGAASAIGFVFAVHALRIGHYAFSGAIGCASFVLPVIFSMAFLEPIQPFQVAGICILVASVFLITFSSTSGKTKSGGKWGRWAMLVGASFLFNGVPQICQVLMSRTNGSVSTFVFLLYLSGTVTLVPMSLGKGRVMPRTLLYGILAGGGSMVGTFCCQLALKALPQGIGSMVVFPVTLSGTLLCAVLLSRSFFKEKINWKGYTGFACELAGIAVLGIPALGQWLVREASSLLGLGG